MGGGGGSNTMQIAICNTSHLMSRMYVYAKRYKNEFPMLHTFFVTKCMQSSTIFLPVMMTERSKMAV